MEFIWSLILAILTFLSTSGTEDITQSEYLQTATTAEVVRVIDGDTIVVNIDGEEQTVRYIGIDTPEPYRDGEPACFSLEASLRNQELVQGKTVRFESGVEEVDRYDRLLWYVYVDDVFVNEQLVKEGYAKTLRIEPNTAYAEQFASLELVARENKKGLWSVCQ